MALGYAKGPGAVGVRTDGSRERGGQGPFQFLAAVVREESGCRIHSHAFHYRRVKGSGITGTATRRSGQEPG
jgi:hypothetical protein